MSCLSSSVGGTHGLFDVRHSEDGWGVRAHVRIGGNQRRHGQAGRQVLRLPASVSHWQFVMHQPALAATRVAFLRVSLTQCQVTVHTLPHLGALFGETGDRLSVASVFTTFCQQHRQILPPSLTLSVTVRRCRGRWGKRFNERVGWWYKTFC